MKIKIKSKNLVKPVVSLIFIVVLFIILYVFSCARENFQNKKEDSIILITQFFIHPDKKRREEFEYAFQQNVNNPKIDKILLLNERIYTPEELKTNSPKIQQVNHKKRLTFQDAFQAMKNHGGNNYYMLSNFDIFFDKTLSNLRQIKLDERKYMIALARNEFKKGQRLKDCKTTGVNWAQDTWIIHSKNLPILTTDRLQKLDFRMGVGRCDNRLAYLLKEWDLKPQSIPNVIRSYHIHDEEEQKKGWKYQKQVPGQGLFLDPDYSTVENYKIPN